MLWAFVGAAVSSPQRGIETMSLVSLQTSDAEKDQMKRWTLSIMGVVTLVGIGLTVSSAMADHDDRLSVSVAFGRGLNTVRPPGDPLAAVNHAILPHKIKVKQGGSYTFWWPDSTKSSCISLGRNLRILSSLLLLLLEATRLSTSPPTNFTWGSIRQGGRWLRRLPPTPLTP